MRKKFIPKTRTFGKWTDISGAPLEAGDVVIIYDQKSEDQHTFQINSVTELEDNVRAVKCTLLDSTNSEYRIGTQVDLTFNPLNYVAGSLIKKDEAMSKMDALQINDVMVVELYKWLMSQPERNYRRKFSECVDYLVQLQLLPEDDDYKLQQKRLTAAIKMRTEYFRSTGGHISATGVEMKETSVRLNNINNSTKTIKRIKLNKLVAGIRLVLESGIFGDIIIEEQ
jgi:hypothetical protein